MNFLKLKFNNKSNSRGTVKGVFDKAGLTMVETLVAISILTIAVIGPLGIIAQALHTSYYTRDQMTAYYLAQEAIEHVRNLRDNQSITITEQYVTNPDTPIESDAWLIGVVASSTGGAVGIPILTNVGQSLTTYSMTRSPVGVYSFVAYNGDDSDYLKIDENGIYGCSPGSAATTSPFKREIYFKKTGNTSTQDFVMVVNVYWKSGSYPSKLTLEEHFTNWASKTGL